MKDKMPFKEVIAKWVIRLPEDGSADVKVKKNDAVKLGEVVAEVKDMEMVYIDASEIVKHWDTEKIKQWKSVYVNKKMLKGEALMKAGGWMGKKIEVPCDGMVITIDEFGQIEYCCGEANSKKVKSPVNAKVSKLETEKICLSFEALEISGEPSGKGKVWGNGKLRMIKEAVMIKAEHRDKIVVVKDIDQIMLSKSEAVGVGGVVIANDKELNWDDYNFSIPAIKINKEVYEKLAEKVDKAAELRMMVNSNTGRLLIVVQ